ncbi:hypothetical protein MO973_21445 [Paenibacillus sp. TRM 82003]|nr:hypothetical protein [Paenibacillus sp. TRM 82003]
MRKLAEQTEGAVAQVGEVLEAIREGATHTAGELSRAADEVGVGARKMDDVTACFGDIRSAMVGVSASVEAMSAACGGVRPVGGAGGQLICLDVERRICTKRSCPRGRSK